MDDLGWYITSNQQGKMFVQNLNRIVRKPLLRQGSSCITPQTVFKLTWCFRKTWNLKLINDDADEAYDPFQSTLLSLFNEHFPIHTENISSCMKSKPWITPGILAAIRIKQRLEKKPARIQKDS